MFVAAFYIFYQRHPERRISEKSKLNNSKLNNSKLNKSKSAKPTIQNSKFKIQNSNYLRQKREVMSSNSPLAALR